MLLGSFQNIFTSDGAIFSDATNFLDISKFCYFLIPLRKYQPEVSTKTVSNVHGIGFSVFTSTLNSLADIVLHKKLCPNSTINTQEQYGKSCSKFTEKIPD